jgi:hypothetical protein
MMTTWSVVTMNNSALYAQQQRIVKTEEFLVGLLQKEEEYCSNTSNSSYLT